jgi:hypothetical protein
MKVEMIKADAQIRMESFIKRLTNYDCHLVADLKTLIDKKSFSRNQEEPGLIEKHIKNSDKHLDILNFLKDCTLYCFLSSNEFRHHFEAPGGLYPIFDPIFIFYESETLNSEKTTLWKKHFQNILHFEEDGIVYKAKYLCCPMLFNDENRILESDNILVINNLGDFKETSFVHLDVIFSTRFKNPPKISKVLLTDNSDIIQLNYEEILLDNFFHGYDFQRDHQYFNSDLNYEFHNNTVIINSFCDSKGYLSESNTIQTIWLNAHDGQILTMDNQHSSYNGK